MKHKHRPILIALILLTVFSVFTINRRSMREQSITVADCFDTVCEITAVTNKKSLLDDSAAYLKAIDSELSATDENSALYKRNHGENAELSNDANELIDFGKRFTEENPEFFSIYLNPLVEAWDIKNNPGTIPDITEAMVAVGEQHSINLGGIAKGFVTDKLAYRLTENGVTSALINLGGNAYAIGKKATGENWKIGIQDPRNEEKMLGIITAENLAVVTSGDYYRYFEKDGKRYHHIFDPKTGFPADSGLSSVTVVAENAALADALSTAIFVAGAEKGAELLKQYGAYGIFVSGDTVYFSKELENIFRQTNFDYKYQFMY